MTGLSVNDSLELGRMRYAHDLREAEIRRMLRNVQRPDARAGLASKAAVWTGDRLISLGRLLVARFGPKTNAPVQVMDQTW